MVTTAFGYSSFGHNAFGQSSADSTITIECREEVYQVAIWYIEGMTQHREVFDIGEGFGDLGQGEIGEATQTGNIVQVHLSRECYVVAIYLFDTDEDLSYLHQLSVWDVDSVFPQLRGAARQWDVHGGVYLSREYEGTPFIFTEDQTPLESVQTELEDKNEAPSLSKDQGRKKIDIVTETTIVEELV